MYLKQSLLIIILYFVGIQCQPPIKEQFNECINELKGIVKHVEKNLDKNIFVSYSLKIIKSKGSK